MTQLGLENKMQVNMIRTPEDLIDDVLVADGWDFCGLNLFSRPDRCRKSPCRKEEAFIETLSRHQFDDSGQSFLDAFGTSPSDDQLFELLRVLNMIKDPDDKQQLLTEALLKIQLAVQENDGRVHDVFKYINETVSEVHTIMEDDANRRKMRTDFDLYKRIYP